VKKAGVTPPPPVDPRRIWTDEANWKAGRVLAVVHADTQTLIGNFQELLHLKVTDARRLVRRSGPTHVDAVETVTGVHWVQAEYAPAAVTSAVEPLRLIVDIFLAEPAVGAMQAELSIFMDNAGIRRVELTEPTTFHGDDWYLELPANVNLMPVMTYETKLVVKHMIDSLRVAL
jgi:hypothetical protein